MSKHTPGPWQICVSGRTVYALHGYPQRNRFSASVQSGRSDDAPLEELEANARLIAAAPDLLDALKVVMAYPHNFNFEVIRAAIAKAEG